MKCPYCGNEMEKGIIESPEPMNYIKEVKIMLQITIAAWLSDKLSEGLSEQHANTAFEGISG